MLTTTKVLLITASWVIITSFIVLSNAPYKTGKMFYEFRLGYHGGVIERLYDCK